MKAKYAILMVFMLAIVASTAAHAQFAQILAVEVDDRELDPSGTNAFRNVDRNQQIDVVVEYEALLDADDVQVEAVIRGHDNSEIIEDITHAEDIRAGGKYVERLKLSLPFRLDQDFFLLRVRISNRDDPTIEQTFRLEISAEENDFIMRDIIFSPGQVVEAGRSLLTTVRVENIGRRDDDDGIKIQIQIPELGLQAADFIDEIDSDDSATSEELYLRIPASARAGSYDAIVSVTFDDGSERVEQVVPIEIENFESPFGGVPTRGEDVDGADRTVISIGSDTQDVTSGVGGTVYPITIRNEGGSAQTYVLNADGYQSWGSVRLDPSNVVQLQAGEEKLVFAFVSAREGVSGVQSFAISVDSEGQTLKQILYKANILGASVPEPRAQTPVTKYLIYGLIVLIVIFVILAVIVTLTRLKEDEDEDKDEVSGQTYY